MAENILRLNIDTDCVITALREAEDKLDGAGGQVILDFVSVGRIDSNVLEAIERLASLADQKAIQIVLEGVNVGVYKVLKLVRLAPRFSFMSNRVDRESGELGNIHAKPSPE